MLKTRIIPCLQLVNKSLVKAVRFHQYQYIGDPCNTVRIFNELEVDELCFLDIRASVEKRPPNFKILQEISNECFMPLSYGGGIKDFDSAKKIFKIGIEKVIVNTHATLYDKNLITKIAEHFGSQAIAISIDLKKNVFHKTKVYSNDGKVSTDLDLVAWAQEVQHLGAGEILLTSMEDEGSWNGYNLIDTKKVSEAVSIPVIANGGCGKKEHIIDAIKIGKASAVAVGSMFVYQKKDMGVLINYFDENEKIDLLKNIHEE